MAVGAEQGGDVLPALSVGVFEPRMPNIADRLAQRLLYVRR